MNNTYFSKIDMARDITENDQNEETPANIITSTLFVEKILLLSNKKLGQDEITYIQVNPSTNIDFSYK